MVGHVVSLARGGGGLGSRRQLAPQLTVGRRPLGGGEIGGGGSGRAKGGGGGGYRRGWAGGGGLREGRLGRNGMVLILGDFARRLVPGCMLREGLFSPSGYGAFLEVIVLSIAPDSVPLG